MSAPHALEPLVATTRRGRPADWLTAQLPLGLVEDDLLRRFVSMFQAVADTVLEHVDNLGLLLDPAVAPTGMVRYLGSWLGEERFDDTLDDVVLRRWVGAAAELLRWRGTAQGLQQLLELVTGRPAEVADDGGVFAEGQAPRRLGHVVVRVQRVGALGFDDLVGLIRRDLPAAVTFELHVDGTPVWPPARPGPDPYEPTDHEPTSHEPISHQPTSHDREDTDGVIDLP